MPNAARAARPQATTQTTPAQATPARPAAPVVTAARSAAPAAAKGGPAVVNLREGARQRRFGQEDAEQIAAASGGGEPLPEPVRQQLEKSLGADLSGVRVHRGGPASEAVKSLSARAVTYGANIFLGPAEKPTDIGLMAHEAAHVVQQQGAPKKAQPYTRGAADPYEAEAERASSAAVSGQRFDVRERTSRQKVQRLGFDDILDWLADKANAIPGFRMFTIVIGVNPVNGSKVDRSAANILRAVVEFIPGGNLITRALDQYGIFEKVGAWIEGQIKSLGMVGSAFKQAISDFIDSLGLRDLLRPGSVWNRAKRIFTEPIDRLINFARGFIGGILDFLREAVLRPLAKLAEGTRAYDLLKAVLGQDPITGDPVPQTADALIGGFMKLIGQEEVYNNIKKGRAVARAFAWFKGVLGGVLSFVRAVPGLIISTLKSITIQDFLPITNLFAKVGKAFGGFVGSFFSWAVDQVLGLLQIIFEVVAPSAVPYIRKAAGAFKEIIRNPIRFVQTLVRAGIQGFKQFAKNFLTHLRKSLIDWITGTMKGAAIYIPQSFTLGEIIKFALSVVGLTWQNIRQKLLKVVPEPVIQGMEAGFDIVVTLVTKGPAAAWDKIKEGVSNLQEMVMGQVMDFVKQKVVEQAIQKLVSSLSPAGAFIQAIIAIYNTIMFFVERIKQIAAVAASFIDSIAAIAAGNTGTAAKRVETTMAGLLTLVISFLARLAGLGKVSDHVLKIVKRVRDPIDKALERVVSWIVATAKRLGKWIGKTAQSLVLRFTKPKTFAAGGEAHRMWITEQGEPQVASAAMPLGTRIGAWKRRVSSLPPADQPTANAQIGVADGLNKDLRKAAADALKARTKKDAAAVDAAQAIIDTKQAALQPALQQLFTIFKDTATAAGAADEARIFALVETYDQVVVPLKRAGLVAGNPVTVSRTFKSQWRAKQIPQARGWITQMERVLAVTRNVGTGRVPYLVAVELKIPGTEIDYTIRDRDVQKVATMDVAVEVKHWGAMRDRPKKKGGVTTVAQQIQQRINTLRNQITSALKDPTYSAAVAEIRGWDNIPPEFRAALLDEFINYRGIADSMKPKKRFTWRKI